MNVFFFLSPRCVAGLGVLLLSGVMAPADARITNIVITTKMSPAFGGQSFGSVGQYEQLDGTASGEIDPRDPLNAVIQDIDLAPQNSRGMVEYSMDLSIVKPIDTSRGRGISRIWGALLPSATRQRSQLGAM